MTTTHPACFRASMPYQASCRCCRSSPDQAEVDHRHQLRGYRKKQDPRPDLGITYDLDVLRLIDVYRSKGLYVGSVVLTRYEEQTSAKAFRQRLEAQGIPVYCHYRIEGYPKNIPLHRQ